MIWACGAESANARAQPYRAMRVWDAAGGGELTFDADAFGQRELGWIVEHALLVDRLWAALPQAGVKLHCPDSVVAMEQDEDGASLELDSGTRLRSRLVVAADGAGSKLRALAGIEPPRTTTTSAAWSRSSKANNRTRRPAGNVSCRPGHWRSCRSRMTATAVATDTPVRSCGRCPMPRPSACCMSTMAHSFASLKRLLPARWARSRPSPRVRHFRCAGNWRRPTGPVAWWWPGMRRMSCIRWQGRASTWAFAMSRHCGGRCTSALTPGARSATGSIPGAPQRLARWARQQRSDNALAAYAFDGLNRLFSNDAVAATLMRGPLLGLVGRLPPLTHAFWRHAAGR